jgi:hypothetical protein
MSAESALDEDSSAHAREIWWGNRRLRYNVALLIAGPLAFVVYAAVGEWCIRKNADVDFEITIFTTLFQTVGYLFMMGIANLFYYLGPLSERAVKPRRIAWFRKIMFALGFWFSVLLPFVVPVLLFLHCRRSSTKLLL